jgi:hypothetical protein
MYMARPRRRGLADVPSSMPQTILGIPIADYCSDWLKWLTNGYCWAYSPAAWGQMSQFASQATAIPKVVPPPAVTSTGVSETVPPTPAKAQAAIDASLAAASAARKQQTLDAFKGMLPVADSGCDPNDPTCGASPIAGLSLKALIAIGLVAGGGLLLMTMGGGRRRR